MKIKSNIITFLLLTFFLSSCGQEDSNDSQDKSAQPQAISGLNGEWVRNCEVIGYTTEVTTEEGETVVTEIPDTWARTSMKVHDRRAEVTSAEYSDDQCTQKNSDIFFLFNFKIGKQLPDSKAYEIDVEAKQIFLTAHSEEEVQQNNEYQFCDKEDWKIGERVDGFKQCKFFREIFDGVTVYSIIEIDSEGKMYFGIEPAENPENRPTTVNREDFLIRK